MIVNALAAVMALGYGALGVVLVRDALTMHTWVFWLAPAMMLFAAVALGYVAVTGA